MVLIDFEKANDRIEWPFFLGNLFAFGFPPNLCKWISLLLKDSTSTILDINGELTNNIFL